jgi:hypothetical protein
MAGKAEHDRGAVDEGHHDRQRDQRHHARLSRPQLADPALQEDAPAVEEDRRAEDRRDPPRSREDRRGIAEPVLQHRLPDQRRHRQRQRQPEPVAEHRDAVAGMLVVPPGLAATAGGRPVGLVVVVMRVHDAPSGCRWTGACTLQ